MKQLSGLLALALAISPQAENPPAYTFQNWKPGEYAVVITVGENGVIEDIRSASQYTVWPAPKPKDAVDVSELVKSAPQGEREIRGKIFGTAGRMPVVTREQLVQATETIFTASQPSQQWQEWLAAVLKSLEGADLSKVKAVWLAIETEFTK